MMAAMEPATVVVLGVGVLGMYLAWRYERRQDEKRNIQYDLRFPELDYEPPTDDTFSARTFVDFEQMLLVSETSDYDYHHTRVYHLRRLDGPKWEISEEDASRERSRAHLAAMKQRGWNVEEREADLDVFDWKPCGHSDDIEPKYQLFLRHRDPSAATFRGRVVETAVEHDRVMGGPPRSSVARHG